VDPPTTCADWAVDEDDEIDDVDDDDDEEEEALVDEYTVMAKAALSGKWA
jgi:hypothetical protein